MKFRNLLVNLLLLTFSVFICLAAAEYAFRKILFGTNPKFSGLRKPQHYAEYSSDNDYWKLYYLFGGEFQPPSDPHPLLGWIGDFDRKTLRHNKADSAGTRRPVLLYGDSYAQCVGDVQCFQTILNNDLSFSKENYFLNYGVGGYGVDQISILFKNTYKQYDRPFVVFSIMADDLDRSSLDNRIGQKPYFEIDHDTLVLKGVPIESNPAKFYKENPPAVASYLWRKLLYDSHSFMPVRIRDFFINEKAKTEHKVRLNDKILQGVFDELKASKCDFVFLVFHYLSKANGDYNVQNDNNWRDIFLKGFIEKNKIPYIWSKDLIRNDTAFNGTNIEKYIDANNGHPTTHLNQLVCSAIKKAVEKSELPK